MLEFMMRSRYHAALFAFLLLTAGVFIPFAPLFSFAVIALAVLRNGLLEGIYSALIASGIVWGLLLALNFGPAWGFAAPLIWIAVIIIAGAVRINKNINVGIILAFLPALLTGVILIINLGGDANIFWRAWLDTNLVPLLQSYNARDEFIYKVQTELPEFMSGAVINSLSINLLGGLLIARYWQAKLYNPGGFGQEFRALKLGKNPAIAGAVVLGLSFIQAESLFFVRDLSGTAALIFMLQGLAVAHSFFYHNNVSPLMIAPFYILVIVLSPLSVLTVAVAGIIDNWIDFRQKIVKV